MAGTLVVGTRNRKKLAEITELLGDLSVNVLDLSHFAQAPEIVENGQSFQENAIKKAIGLARALDHWVLGEDSGLMVPAIGNEPGVFSARYAGKQGDDDANNALLLANMANVPDERRDAYYVCVVAVSDPQGNVMATGEARCHGRIARELRGTGGFGYDPLFLIPEYHRTFGELSPRVKHALSHRARAISQLRPTLRSLFPA